MAVDDSYTKLLLHCDGADASTTFTDESGKTITANGNAQIDTAQSVFGGASYLGDGTTDYLSGDLGTDVAGTGDFTVDFRARVVSFVDYISFFEFNRNSNTGFSIGTNAAKKLVLYNPALGEFVSVAAAFAATNTWYHVAVVRSGTSLRVYVDGTDIGGATNSTNLTATGISVGARVDGSECLSGWIDEVRYSKGIARWTANFTPPTSAYAPASAIKTLGGLAKASVKTVGGLAIASVKTIGGLS